MATYNSAIKINAAVSATGSGAGSTLYTAPANGYAEIQILMSAISATSSTLTIGTRPAEVLTAVQTVAVSFTVGPSQAVAFTATGGAATATWTMSGVEFVNSI